MPCPYGAKNLAEPEWKLPGLKAYRGLSGIEAGLFGCERRALPARRRRNDCRSRGEGRKVMRIRCFQAEIDDTQPLHRARSYDVPPWQPTCLR